MELLERHFDTAFDAPDGIKKLRELILTLAMQGKLVPQDPNDLNASKRLNAVGAEKRLIANQHKDQDAIQAALKPRGDQFHELPPGWTPKSLGKILSFEYGENLPAHKRSESGEFPVYGSNGVVGTHNIAFVHQPCIIIGRKGSAGALNLCRALGCCVTDVAYYCIPPRGVDLIFAFWLLRSLGLDSLGKGIKPGLNRNEAYELSVVLPPLLEQERIVSKIDELMARCDALEKLRAERDAKRLAVHSAAVRQLLNVANTDGHVRAREFLGQHFGELYTVKENVTELRKAILQLAVMGKLVPQDPNDPPASELLKQIEAEKRRLFKEGKLKGQKPSMLISGDDSPFRLPKGWEWVRVNNLVEVGTGSTPPTTNRDYYTGSIPWYTSSATNRPIADIPETLISEDAIRDTNCKVFPAGSLIIALYGQGKTRGQISELPVAGATNQAIAVMVFYDSSLPIKAYLKHFFVKIYEEIRSIAEGAAQPNLNVGKVKDTLVPLPPLREQHRIVAKIDQLMSLCDTLEQQIDAARETQSAMLNAMMAQYGGQRCA